MHLEPAGDVLGDLIGTIRPVVNLLEEAEDADELLDQVVAGLAEWLFGEPLHLLAVRAHPDGGTHLAARLLGSLEVEVGGVCSVQFGDTNKPFVPVRGIRPVWHDIEQRFVTEGRTFTSIDEESRRNVCLVNDKAIEEFALPKDPSGQVILVDKRRFVIVGVVETKQVSPMFGGDEAKSEVFVPFSLADSMRPDRGMYIVAQTKSPELFEDAKAEVTFYMRRVRGLKPDDPNTFGVEAIEQFITQVKKMAMVITVVASALDRSNLFVVPLDDRRTWYRYHHLFADVLRARLLDEDLQSLQDTTAPQGTPLRLSID